MKTILLFLLMLLPITSFSQTQCKDVRCHKLHHLIDARVGVNSFGIHEIYPGRKWKARNYRYPKMTVLISNLFGRIIYKETINKLPFYSTREILMKITKPHPVYIDHRGGNGVYFISLEDENGEVILIEKFIVNLEELN